MTAKAIEDKIVVSGHLAWLSKKLGIEPWGQILVASLIVGVGATASFLWSFNGRMSKVEGQLSVLLSEHFLNEAARLVRKGNERKAVAALGEAQRALRDATEKQVEAPVEYFQASTELLDEAAAAASNQASVADQIHGFRVALATYRSVLEPSPAIPKELVDIKPGTPITAELLKGRNIYRVDESVPLPPKRDLSSYAPGAAINASKLAAGAEILVPATRSWMKTKIL